MKLKQHVLGNFRAQLGATLILLCVRVQTASRSLDCVKAIFAALFDRTSPPKTAD